MRRHRTRPDRWQAAALAVLAAGAVAVITLQVVLPGRQLYAVATVRTLAVVPAVAVAALLLGTRWLHHRLADRHERAVTRERDRAREDRRRFLLRLDHELKNPLQVIRVALAVRPTDPAGPGGNVPPAVTGGGVSADAQVVRITRLVTDLRKLAEFEVHPLEIVRVDLRELLEEVTEAAADLPGADTRNFSIVIPRAPWPLPEIDGDRDLLFTALHNLIANAVKYSAPGDDIEVRASDAGTAVAIEVADTGAGIPADEQDTVWEELARGRGALAVPGSGLGLPLVRVVIARHGGTTALSSRDGEGTVVTVRLPAVGRAADATPVGRALPA